MKKKAHARRAATLLLAILMVLTIVPVGTISSSAAGKMTLAQLQAKFPSGKYWNGGDADSYTSKPCTHHGNCKYNGSCGCNSFLGLSIQCMGYAEKLGYDFTGYNPRNNANGWKTYTSSSALDSLKPGDIVRYKNNGHSIFVTAVNGNTVTYTDCNSDGHCIIRWGATISKSTLKSTFTHVRSAPYAISGGTTVTLTADSKYNTVKGFKAYPCVTSDFEVKKADLTTRGGEIYTSDFCTINALYTNGWCKVTFPMDSGGTRTAYTKISNFIKTPSASLKKYTATDYIDLYSTSSLKTQIYRIYPGDVCYTIGTSGSATQIFMPMSGKGYYVLGWAVLPPAQESCGYDVPFKCRTISTAKVKCYNDINFKSSPGYIYPTDDCVIEAVYSNGKVKVKCPWTDGSTKTVYVNKSVFINSSSTPKNSTAVRYAKTYLRTDMGTNIGWIDAGDKIQIVATSGNKTQIIYPADSGKRCAWVKTSDLTQTYTVAYNANGGTGAPAKQTKTHAKDLTLSTAAPTRTGYTFVGWSTSKTATSATYLAGSVYTKDASVTLYAVWRKKTFEISYDANGGINAPSAQIQTYGTGITVSSVKPSKPYAVSFDATGGTVEPESATLASTFVAWNTKPDGTGTMYQPGSTFKPNANATLYAIYDAPTLDIYPTPVKDGYVFTGWYTAENGGALVSKGAQLSADTILYAGWEPAPEEPATVASVTVSAMPNKTEYIEGEAFESAGLTLTAHMSDGTEQTVTSGFTVSGYDPGRTGQQTLTVTYGGKSATFTVTVRAAQVQPEPTGAKITVSQTSGIVGGQARVTLRLDENPGITSMLLSVSYDTNALRLVKVEDKGILGSAYHSDNLKSPYTLSWANDTSTSNFTADGEIVTLVFDVLDTAPLGESAVTVRYDYDNYDIIDKDMNPIRFAVTDGSVRITDVLVGDVNGDGAVNTLDRVVLTRYLADWAEYPEGSINLQAADVNGDGAVNTLDRVILTRYLANWNGYEALPYTV